MRVASIACAALAGLVLAGCAGISNEVIQNNRQIDASTYEIEIMQAWVKDETLIREQARRIATDFCLQTQRGMQPLQVYSLSPSETGKGAMARMTYRCVGYLQAPKREYQPLIIHTPSLTDDEYEEMSKK